MLKRNLTQNLVTALADTPVVLLNGARQTGKSTLVQNLPKSIRVGTYYNLDDFNLQKAAQADPLGFVQRLPERVILDEIQRAPELFRAIKLEVDRKRTPGRFLLTGSANILLLPQLSESLAGRMELITLWPFSQGEIEGVKENFIDVVFNHTYKIQHSDFSVEDIVERIIQGGFPEILLRKDLSRRKAWFDSYITTILQRDVRDLSSIEGVTELPRLLALLAARTTGLLNFAELSRSTAIPQTTLKRYLNLLEMVFLFQQLPAWSTNYSKKLIKSPKIMIADTGLLTHLIGANKQLLLADKHLLGRILENFVVMELFKQTAWSKVQPKIYHFRNQTGQEVDIVLENAAGEVIGIEVKSAATVTKQDFKGLQVLAETAGNKFKQGIVLYLGRTVVPFGKNYAVLPVNLLWKASN